MYAIFQNKARLVIIRRVFFIPEIIKKEYNYKIAIFLPMDFAVINVLLSISFVTTVILSTLMAIRSGLLSSKFLSASAFGAVAWISSMIIFMNAKSPLPTIAATKMLYIAGAVIVTNFVYFTYTFLQEKLKDRKIKAVIIGLPMLLFFPLIIFTNSVISDVEFVNGIDKIVRFGQLYYLYVAYMVVWSIFGYYCLQKKSSYIVDAIQKRQLFWIGWGTISSVTFGLVFDLILPMFGNFDFYWVGPVLVTFFVVFASYAIAKHHLFNVKVITTELFSAILFIVLVVKFVLSESTSQFLLNGIVGLSFAMFGILLIRSVWKEVRTREELQKITGELAKANEQLKQLDAAKSEFISIASHQLRAPLTVIRGYISLILEGSLGAVGGKTKEALDRVFIAASQMIRLISDMLNLSRVESGKIRYEFQPNDLVKVVEEVIREFSAKALEKQQTLEFTNQAGQNLVFPFDKDKLREIVVNLIDNAIKYSQPQKHIWVKIEKLAERARLSVRDEGLGIKPEDKQKLFAKFSRTDEARSIDPGGMGIGLYFFKRVVEDHKGEVGVESEGLGKGSTFWMELPMK